MRIQAIVWVFHFPDLNGFVLSVHKPGGQPPSGRNSIRIRASARPREAPISFLSYFAMRDDVCICPHLSQNNRVQDT
eukprot:395190-Alexandrium_andersonii.AAC.1